ncbi:FixH family protein [Novispirillum itersonii]|uniref:Nitrogen fixation protein FixH n=1 Tax=Novispirillum itersonii TaxID=189 RepID=A0A7W9ZHA9_NOVIT|nr:FixH family protein [Novispirillum itersonii]MBB6211466.1 nitrogen fixation protein FixH [Novispirillum itersonii]
MAEAQVGQKRRDGWWYPWIFVAGFAVVLSVNAIMIFFATTTFNGLETADPYEKGVAYNKEIAAADAQAALGWSGDFVVTGVRPGDGDGRKAAVRFQVKAADGAPVDGLTVIAELRRPTQAGMDQKVELLPSAPGEYAAVLSVPLPGLWDVRVVSTRAAGTPNQQIFRLNSRLELR